MYKIIDIFKKLFEYLLTFLTLIFIVFIEVIWEKSAKPIFKFLSKIIDRINVFDRIIEKIDRLNPYIVLIIFLIFFTIVELLGIYAAILFFRAEIFLAVFVYLLKLPFAVVILWFFDITKPKLLSFRWFEIVYGLTLDLKLRIQNSRIYNKIYNKFYEIKNYLVNKFDITNHPIYNRVIEFYEKVKKRFDI
ncbi:hypothetical protein [Arcobacter porcinus]|uniref:Bll5565 protein n=1 Tax=Arcobacter porcinus TaxID=1935204 RepID=A0ABX2YEW2_9BACT|nr:hypothetical protein [Arcobacter porcinus]OCL81725.1 hypothetical protein AAW30_01818 [Arcobacter porcinus]OCL84483.1 hypothetical protein AAW29_00156 [Arcobacter porcinus]OCL89024.1 hypothetical protein AAX30_00156 [Arcobacter porcinus]OCL93534.1 hypothetical protein AAX28_01077 [Arcobacter porcinus]